MFVRKQDEQYLFRHFNPSRKRINIVDTFCGHFTQKRPFNLMGFIPRIDHPYTTAIVWTEIYYFMKGAYNPFNRPDNEFLPYDRRFRNYVYTEELGKNISML